MSKLRLSIDIKGHIVKAVEGILLDDDFVKVKKTAYIDMSNGVFNDERLVSCQENIDLMRGFIKRNKFKAKKAVLNISDAKIVTRVIKLPKLPIEDINSLIEVESPKYFPIDISKFHIDYRILDTFNENEKLYYKILLCAVPKEVIREYVDLFTGCGLRLTLIDIHSNSISRLYENIEFDDVAVLDGNAKAAELLILEKGNYYIYTSFPFKIPNYLELYKNPNEYEFSQLNEELDSLIKNIESYIKFYLTKNEGKGLERIYLVGDITNIEGIEEKLSQRLRLYVTKGFEDFIDVKKTRKTSKINENMYGGNIGILLRGV